MSEGISNGDNLRKRRVRLGLSQAELADILGVPANSIARWERGVVEAQHWQMLFRALNDIADELAAETDNQRRYERNLRIRALTEEEIAAGRELSGHGHVTPNPDGTKARCGGPSICSKCALEAARAGLAFTGQSLTTDVRSCARCGKDHPGTRFTRMENPVDPEYPFWAPCPNGGGPILLMSVEVAG